MKIPTLSVLNTEALEIQRQLQETGELTPELELKHDENKNQLAVKLDHYCYAYRAIEQKQEYLANLKKQVDQATKSLENQKNYLMNKLEATKEIHKFEANSFKFSYRKSKRLVVLDPQKLPMDCVKVELKPIADKIKEKISEGVMEKEVAFLEEHESLGFKEKI